MKWEPTDRTARVAAGGDSIIWVTENANEGWAATFDGEDLTPVTIDGWAQGWRLPEGEAGEVELVFEPQQTFVVSLGVGAAAVLVVLLLTGWRWRRTRGVEQSGIVAARPLISNPRTIKILAWEAIVAASILAGAGLVLGAMLPLLRPLSSWRERRLILTGLVVVATFVFLVSDRVSTLADALICLAVGLLLSPARAVDREGPQ